MAGVLLVLALLSSSSENPALEQRVMSLSQQLRCLVCQNETIADSQADLAADLRQQIREQMKAGRSNAEITTFLTDRYGDFVLYRPQVKPRTYALWFGPFVLLAGGLYSLFRFLKHWPQLKIRPLSAADHRRAMELLQSGKGPNISVYRDHFTEMESDLRDGVIVSDQFERERDDLERRLLDDCRETP